MSFAAGRFRRLTLHGLFGAVEHRSGVRERGDLLRGHLCAELGDDRAVFLSGLVEEDYRQENGTQDSGQDNTCHFCPSGTEL
nr:hypothetical protein OG781_16920 [Streptomyces sp. NBC_00830]